MATSSQSEGEWLRGDLHAHTVHSDGLESVAEVVERARAAGLAFLAITDHNTTIHHPVMAALPASDLVLIPGQEVTTPLGHLNVWGPAPASSGGGRTDQAMRAVIAQARRAGAVCSINHPKTQGPPWRYSVDLPVDALEVWQTHWACYNAESLALWDQQLAAGRRLTAVGGSDYHGPVDPVTALRRIGWPTVWVKSGARTTTGILDAIRAGRTSLSAYPDGPRVDARAWTNGTQAGLGQTLAPCPGEPLEAEVSVMGGVGGTLRVIADGVTVHEEPISQGDFTFRRMLQVRRYLRAEVLGETPGHLRLTEFPPGWDSNHARQALSNAIYVRPPGA